MNKEKMRIWEREFELDVIYDQYSGEDILPIQEDAIKKFIENHECINDSLEPVKKYCLQWNKNEIGTDIIDNIFKYVKPKSLYIKRSDDDSRIVVMMCAYKFYSDNKIAVVFRNERFEKVVIDDEVI